MQTQEDIVAKAVERRAAEQRAKENAERAAIQREREAIEAERERLEAARAHIFVSDPPEYKVDLAALRNSHARLMASVSDFLTYVDAYGQANEGVVRIAIEELRKTLAEARKITEK